MPVEVQLLWLTIIVIVHFMKAVWHWLWRRRDADAEAEADADADANADAVANGPLRLRAFVFYRQGQRVVAEQRQWGTAAAAAAWFEANAPGVAWDRLVPAVGVSAEPWWVGVGVARRDLTRQRIGDPVVELERSRGVVLIPRNAVVVEMGGGNLALVGRSRVGETLARMTQIEQALLLQEAARSRIVPLANVDRYLAAAAA